MNRALLWGGLLVAGTATLALIWANRAGDAAPPLSRPPRRTVATPVRQPTIVFSSDRGNEEWHYDVYTATLYPTGVQLRRLTNQPEGGSSPSWSPDGKRIVFQSRRDDPNDEIYVMDVDGTNVQRLTHDDGYDWGPRWSPDGTRIAWDTGPCGQLRVMDADGTDKQTLNAGPGVNTQPDWSPDSQRLVFVSNRDGNGGVANGEIYRMKVDGTEVMRLTNNPEHDYQPAWSPDGQRIAFTRYWLKEPKQYRIFVMNADGSGETELTKTWGTRGGPRWSPDGQKLIFSQSVGGWNIYTMDLHTMTPPGTEVKLLIGGKSIEWEADWLIPR